MTTTFAAGSSMLRAPPVRGGEFTYVRSENGYDFDLARVKWTDDVEVSGTISWNLFTDDIAADVRVFQNGRRVGRLDIEWDDAQCNAVARLSGTIGDSRLEARRIAP